ncbi:MAG: carboxypeptidase-like regulatory domain-containing protein [Pyrinomonadaceae bacterium]
MKFGYFFAVIIGLILSGSTALAQDGSIKGKVKLEGGGGASAVTVTVRLGEEDVASAVTGKNGEFVIGGLKPGSYSVTFRKSGYNSGILRKKVTVNHGIVELGDRLVLQIDPTLFAYVRGSVFDPVGRSVPGAKVELWRLYTDGKAKKVKETVSGESGEFNFKLPADVANYRVKVQVERAEPDERDVTVDGAEIYRLVPFNLKPKAKS